MRFLVADNLPFSIMLIGCDMLQLHSAVINLNSDVDTRRSRMEVQHSRDKTNYTNTNYDLNWEYVPGKRNTVADGLSRIKAEESSFEGKKKEILNIYHVLQDTSGLEKILHDNGQRQLQGDKIKKLVNRIQQNGPKTTPFF